MNSIVSHPNLIDALKNIEDLEVFDAESVKTLIEYKWDHVGRRHHITGFWTHLLFLILVITYVH